MTSVDLFQDSIYRLVPGNKMLNLINAKQCSWKERIVCLSMIYGIELAERIS